MNREESIAFGVRVKQIRIESKLNKKEFARSLGVSSAYVTFLELGEKAGQPVNPTVPLIFMIAHKFGVDIEWLKTGKGSMRRALRDRANASLSGLSDSALDKVLDFVESLEDTSSQNASLSTGTRTRNKRDGAELSPPRHVAGSRIFANGSRITSPDEEFRCTFDQAPIGLAILRTDFQFHQVNGLWLEITGYSKEELLSRKFSEIIHPDHAAKHTATMQGMLAGETGSYEVETRCIRNDGREIWVKLRALLVRKADGSPRHFIAAIDDVTQHKAKKEGFQERYDRLVLAAEALGVALWSWSEDEGLCWHSTPRTVTGVDADQLRTIDDSLNHMPPEDVAIFRPLTLEILDKCGQINFDYRYIWPDGSIHQVISRGQAYRSNKGFKAMVGILFDITETKRVEAALRDSQALLSTIIESIPFEIWAFGLDGRCLLANSATLRRYGNIIGKKPEEITSHQEESLRVNEMIRKVLNGENVDEVVKSTYPFGSMNNRFHHRVIVPIEDRGQLWGAVGIDIDITERKTLEESLRKARDELELRVRERTKELDEKSRRLEEFNAALKILLKQREEDKRDLEQSVLSNVKSLVAPYLDKLKESRLGNDQMAYVTILESHIKEIVSPFAKKISEKYLGLTPVEIQTASLIKDGKTTQEIANILCVSESTVASHRFSIRKKLGLTKKKANLRTKLQIDM